MIHATTATDLKNTLRDRSQTQKATHHMNLLLRSPEYKSIETGNRLVVARDWEAEGMRGDCLMRSAFPLGERKMFWNEIEVMVAQHCGPYQVSLSCTH